MIHISISEEAYKTKPTSKDYSSMSFEKQTIELPQLFDYIKKGHSFCSNMGQKSFNIKQKTNNNFTDTQVIVIDIDNTNITPNQFYFQSTIKPTYLYTSFSHNPQQNKNKYHLLYIFDEKITNKAQFESLYDKVCTAIHNDFADIQLDNSMKNVAQLTNGTTSNGLHFQEYYNYSNIDTYSISDFNVNHTFDFIDNEVTDNEVIDNELKVDRNTKTKNTLNLDEDFENDLNTLTTRQFLDRYDKFEYRERSTPNYNDLHYEILDNTNAELYIPYRVVKDENGTNYTRQKRIEKGKGKRRKTLISHGLAFRIIFPNITAEHLVYCLIKSLYYYFDNTDNKYKPYKIKQIAALCLQHDMTNYKPQHKHKFQIDVAWCKEQGIIPQSHQQKIKKMLTDEEIGKYYDCNLSVRQNVKVLKENGVKVSRGRVSQFKKEHNL